MFLNPIWIWFIECLRSEKMSHETNGFAQSKNKPSRAWHNALLFSVYPFPRAHFSFKKQLNKHTHTKWTHTQWKVQRHKTRVIWFLRQLSALALPIFYSQPAQRAAILHFQINYSTFDGGCVDSKRVHLIFGLPGRDVLCRWMAHTYVHY